MRVFVLVGKEIGRLIAFWFSAFVQLTMVLLQWHRYGHNPFKCSLPSVAATRTSTQNSKTLEISSLAILVRWRLILQTVMKNTSPTILYCGQALTFTIDDFELSTTVPLFVLHNEVLVEEIHVYLMQGKPSCFTEDKLGRLAVPLSVPLCVRRRMWCDVCCGSAFCCSLHINLYYHMKLLFCSAVLPWWSFTVYSCILSQHFTATRAACGKK